ncbi:acetyl-CoA carboxylase biotin carboxyl carrier protein [Allorhizobium taibaishanense]|uniref:Biotin carboxyl carrier protein of acetyl-CoA carboxylase n=1 Tax=Allorhizobium taibaishanense TaxID=887144 RepID=A0A1Q8ZYL6_9HYPH|nr:acetyl-CoA carboxylase biotin carboxyl carrier protein [Allorhizobium taibaishanense]MBB4007655.1 acetyl-CoA carboxylase biotin carboxyl carrier protein [Allorhizobium taibaishanense]OLP47423.1 acetyl-CoA carboxylase, biotin carboxyl carrier protein [Allorhizobium taibaishanense]
MAAEKKTGIDQALIRELANILNETDLSEIEVEQDAMRIRVSRAAPQMVAMPQMQYGAPYGAPAPAPAPAAAPAVAAPAARDLSKAVTAPMVGTVYMSPAPGSAPFITVGATVKEGQTLLIIEAMKTMNQIPSPRSGKIVEILIDDASPVEYGEAMVIIE